VETRYLLDFSGGDVIEFFKLRSTARFSYWNN